MHGDYNKIEVLTFSIRQTWAGYRNKDLEPVRMDSDFSSGVHTSTSPWRPEFQPQHQQHQRNSLVLPAIPNPGVTRATPSEDVAQTLQYKG